MTSLRHDRQAELKSVNRLLEISEMKHYQQQIEVQQSQQFSPHRGTRDAGVLRGRYKGTQNSKNLSLSLQRTPLEMREKQIASMNWNDPSHRGTPDCDQHAIHFNSMLGMLEQTNPLEPSSARLPQLSRNQSYGDRIAGMSSTFHPASMNRPHKNEENFMESYRYIRGNELSSILKQKSPSPHPPKGNVVYLRPNKAQTIRELLNQMKTVRGKHQMIQLNSLLTGEGEGANRSSPMMFSDNQLKELKKYKNFIPFREDERLLIQKIGERESVWKRKFKESWQRRKIGQEGRRQNLKPILKQPQ